MLIQRAAIVALLRQRGQDVRADWVERELPDEVDTYHHAGLLDTLRISASDLSGKAPAELPDTAT